MSRWYRAYSGTVRDDKLAECAIIAGCSRAIIIATWHAILESAADAADGGRFDTTPRRVAALLVEPAAIIEAVFAAMTEVDLIGDGVVTAWKKRQYESDNSTERSRKHREAKRNGDATLQGRSATPPDTEAETETDKPSSLRSEGARKRAAPACLMPDDFEPSREDAFRAGMTEAETDREIAKFRDWAASAPADKARKRDWPATWRNWCRRVVETRPAHRTTGPPRPAVPKAHEQAARLQLILNEAESVTADRERQADRTPVALLAQR